MANKLFKAWNKKGQRLRPGGHSTFNRATLRWLKKRKQGVSRAKVVPEPLRLRVLAIAKTYVGVMEHGGNNRGAQVLKIIKNNGGTGPEPWCGDFDAEVYRLAGSRAVRRAWAATRYLGRIGGMQSVGRYQMRPGDIVVYNFPGGHPDSDHTGIFEHYSDHNGKVHSAQGATHIVAIEGNTGASGAVSDSATGGDGVYRKVRNIGLVNRGVKVLK